MTESEGENNLCKCPRRERTWCVHGGERGDYHMYMYILCGI